MKLLILILSRFGARHARLAPGQTLLLIAILALGVGVFTAVRLANRAAAASFTHFTDAVTGGSDWVIQAPTGDLPESVLPELRTALADLSVQIHPVVEAAAAEPILATSRADGTTRRTFTLLGVDLVAAANLAALHDGDGRFFRNESEGATSTAGGPGFFDLFGEDVLAWTSPGLRPRPARLHLVVGDRPVDLIVAGDIPQAAGTTLAPVGLVILDLPRLQSLLGRPGRLSRIEFVTEDGYAREERRAEAGRRLAELGAGSDGVTRWLVDTPGGRRDTATTMTEAFRLNLTVLSLIALLVGLYLVFQALDGAVARRRSEIAMLRSLGVEAAMIRRAWLAEAAALGLAGGAVGLLLGWAGAQIAVRAVSATVNALYHASTVTAATLSWSEAAWSLLAGVVASMIAGWAPARAAAATPPAQILVRSAPGGPGGRWLRSAPLAMGAAAAAWSLTFAPPVDLGGGTRFPAAGHAASFLAILGGGVLASLSLSPLARSLRRLGGVGPSCRIALGHLARPTGRHRLAAAALVCAIGMAAGMAILVGSFELSVKRWIANALQADLYISSAGSGGAGAAGRISPALWQTLAAHPAVAESAVYSAYPLILEGKPTTLGAGDLADQARREAFLWVGTPAPAQALDPGQNANSALISESFSERFSVQRGDVVTVPTPAGAQTLRVAGVFADYGNERGSVLVDRSHAARWFDDESATSVALYLRPGVQSDALRAELLTKHPGLVIFTHGGLRAEVLRVFRQTFSITYALEAIGLVVAVAGLGLSLASVLLDRREELTTLRALGFSRDHIARAAALEGGLLAACATMAGIGLSFALGWILIHVINKQSFGWTLAYDPPTGLLGALALAVTATGTLVGYGVGRQAADLRADREHNE